MILVYKDSGDDELQAETFENLVKFGLNEDQINARYEKIKSKRSSLKAFERASKRQSERNEREEYTLLEKVKIFLFGPFDLFMRYETGLKQLYDFNYKTKFRQRLILLILGVAFWFSLGYFTFLYHEHKRIEAIEKADISAWENNRIIKKSETVRVNNISLDGVENKRTNGE